MRLLRNLIIISVLLVSVTVQASGVDELVRIKQNYARMLVPSGKDPFGLLSILSSIQPETEISDQVVAKHIKNVVRCKVILSNGVELSVPKVRYTEVRKKFIACQGEV